VVTILKDGTVKFGTFAMTPALVDSDHAQLYRDFVDIAVEVERLGFWSLWTTEHHFSSDKTYRPYDASLDEYPVPGEYDLTGDPLTLLAYVAAKTSRLRLGTAVLCLPWDHPVRAVERAKLLDVLSGGRLELGVGRGGPTPRVGEVFGVPTDPSAANRKFREEVEILVTAWGGEPFSHTGEFYQLPPNLTTLPRPVQKSPPIWVGSASDESAAWAAQQGFPYATIAWPLTYMEEYKHKREVYLDAAEQAGVDVSGSPNVCLLYCYCGESDDEAETTAYEHMKQFEYINEQHYQVFRNPAAVERVLAGSGYDTIRAWADAMAQYTVDNHIVGGIDTVVERLKYHEEELGTTYVMLNIAYGLMPKEKAYASMKRIAEHVMPHFSAVPSAVSSRPA
jgi:alkanesulfonate monooxygenase SsuD/methylene tetrahydromethanopterin reductase-like flavin-dependent oxidoreductase (luciferase family)